MTPKQEKIVWIVYALVLVLLFFISSTDIIIKEKVTEVYPISVIIDDTTDDYYVNFKKGVDQAARDYQVDVSFITLYEKKDSGRQIERVIREINDGAQAIILSPVEDDSVLAALDENLIGGPLVIVNSELSHNKISVNISEDYYAVGRTLAEHVVEKTPADVPVYLMTEGMERSAHALAYDGVMSVLEEGGYQTRVFQIKSEEEYRSMIGSMVYPKGKETVLVALDMKSLTAISRILDESTVYQNYAYGLYGLGSNLSVLNFLDSGIIEGIVVTNDFIQGYLSIQKAVEAIQNSGVQERVRTEHFYIEKEDIRKKEYQKLLYPID